MDAYYLRSARGNATRAPRVAGHAGSAEVLKVQGSRLLTRATVRAAIDANLARETRAAVLAADERDVPRLICALAFTSAHDRIRAIAKLNRVTGRH